MKLVAKIFAVLAILGLIISSFAFVPFAGAQTVGAAPVTVAALDRDLTIGATGPEVAAMQSMLISFGYSIPAGPTGYFGVQTRAALASFQVARGIMPAAGYFGPLTRAAFAATTPATVAPPGNERKNEAEEAMETATDALERAEDRVEEAEDENRELNDAEDYLEEGAEWMRKSREYFDAREYKLAESSAWNAEDAADMAIESIGERNDRDADENDTEDEEYEVSMSARAIRGDGPDNDVARFEIDFRLEAFGDAAYVDEDADVSVNYQIENQEGNVIVGATTRSASLDSSADEDDGYFRVSKGNGEEFELLVVFDPLAADEGQLFRLQLLSVEYNDSPSAPDSVWRARPDERYRTDSVYIGD